MKSIKLFVACIAIVTILALAFINIKKVKKTPDADKGFAVIELFTSEGCSSCPPADALVARLQKESAGKPVYILAYHVDYWDRLGWKDAFSDAAYSARQRQYARWIKGADVYTPQAIVNGRKEFVGSQEGTLRNVLKAGLAEIAKTELQLSDVKTTGGKVTLKYQAKGAMDNSSLVVALVEKNATSKVMKGENAGRTLAHVQIVRKLQTVALANHNSGSVSLQLPEGFSTDAYEVIAFVQNTIDGNINGAAKAEFSSTLGK